MIFRKICWKSSSFIKVRQEKRAVCVKTNLHFQSYLAQFFSECFRQNVLNKIKTNLLFAGTYLKSNHAIHEII